MTRSSPINTVTCLLAFILLAFFALQCGIAARATGQTMDESFYNASGYPIVRYHDYRFLGEHPPLMMILGSLPLLALAPKFPIHDPVHLPDSPAIDLTKTGEKFLYKMGNAPQQLLFWERMPVLLLALLLGLVLFVWSRETWGNAGGLLSLGLYAFSPDITAHSSLFTTDLGLSVFFFAAVYLFQQFLKNPGFIAAATTGTGLGLALLAKISALLLLPVLAGLLAAAWLEGYFRQIDFPKIKFFLPSAALFLVLSWGQKTIMALSLPLCLVALAALLLKKKNPSLAAAAGWGVFIFALAWIVVALGYVDFTVHGHGPYYHYVRSLQIVRAHAASDHRICVPGSFVTCDWRYFPALLAVKMPLAYLALIGTGFAALAAAPFSKFQKAAILLPPATFFFFACFIARLNIGVRHILPVYPFFFLIAGGAWAFLSGIANPWLRKLLIASASAWLAVTAARNLSFSEDALSYFNETVGSPEKAAALLADSNLVWGQDNKRLAQWAHAHKISSMKIASLAANPAEWNFYGLEAQGLLPSDWARPAAGFYALDISVLQALSPDSWFRKNTPVGQAGRTFRVFKV